MSERVWVMTLVKNEHVLMPYWIRHYAAFAERIIVYDDASDDDTWAIAQAGGAEVRAWTGNGAHIDDYERVAFANGAYIEARGQADWIIWADGDEFFYHRTILDKLATYRAEGIVLPRVEGWAMIAPELPTTDGQIWQQCNHGVPAPPYCKPTLFCPELNLNWDVGKHQATVDGRFVSPEQQPDAIKLLHYRWFGKDYNEQRAKWEWERMAPQQAHNFAGHYEPGSTLPYSVNWYETQIDNAQMCI